MISTLKTHFIILTVGAVLLSCQSEPSKQDVDQLLNDLHIYASQANGEAYFELFAEDAVFFGTDMSERWDKAAFQDYAMARFAEGTGWTYHMKERNVYFSDNGNVAWFDEILTNKKYGEFRGTGVLKRINNQWKIVQYNLLLPIPNDLFFDMSQEIKEYYQ